MTEHLLLSTAVLAVILVAARVLPLTARTRSALLLCGILKFAVPVVHISVEAVPQPLRVFGASTAATTIAQAATRHIDWLPIAWASIATLLFARWLILRTRTVNAALHDATPASERETRIVRDARVNVSVVRSPMCEAPAVLRVRKPVIVLPTNGCNDLDDDELRAVILHECAHVARRDNLATIVQALATSLLWFHPLVWIASRQLTAAREEACDETVADAMLETDSYLSALTKIGHALAAPPAGASCVASANLERRLEHLMSYGSLKKRALSHGAAIVAAVLLIAVSAVAGTTTSKPVLYKLHKHITRVGEQVRFHFIVGDPAGAIVSEPIVNTSPNQPLTTHTEIDGTKFVINAAGDEHKGRITFDVIINGEVQQSHIENYDQTSDRYNWQPVSIRVHNLHLQDLMQMFSELTGLDITIVSGAENVSVTMDVVNMPWDEALEKIAEENGLVITVRGRTIMVAPKK